MDEEAPNPPWFSLSIGWIVGNMCLILPDLNMRQITNNNATSM
jgi:hypothetical protein